MAKITLIKSVNGISLQDTYHWQNKYTITDGKIDLEIIIARIKEHMNMKSFLRTRVEVKDIEYWLEDKHPHYPRSEPLRILERDQFNEKTHEEHCVAWRLIYDG